MRPFRSRVLTAFALTLLLLGLVQGVIRAADLDLVPDNFPEDPPPSLSE